MKPPKILDNKKNGRVIDEMRKNIDKGTKLSVISAYFTIYAYAELKKELSKIDKTEKSTLFSKKIINSKKIKEKVVNMVIWEHVPYNPKK